MRSGASALRDLGATWDALAPSPFLTVAWLDAWYAAFGAEPAVQVLRGPDGDLLAGAALRRTRHGMEAAANVHSGDWDVVAKDDQARAGMWRGMLEAGPAALRLEGLIGDAPGRTRCSSSEFGGREATASTRLTSATVATPRPGPWCRAYWRRFSS